ncbi:hypothetical protein RUM43_002376 [Polyplax serrata]|uniref:TIR domain-containing protein n=1 Tax=Polyplax serrata TaxID=468196 RepID=A0AAN8NZ45_POLSC
MEPHNSGLYISFPFLLVMFLFGSLVCSLECRGKDCRPVFECPGPYNCTCARGIAGDYELLCPGMGQTSVLSASIMPNKYIQIQCTYATHFTDYNLLNGLKIGPVISVNFRLCPLPNLPFSDLTKAIGINSTSALLFQSYRNLSNTLERKHFKDLTNLTRLVLSSNGLTELPEDLLQDLTNLTWLDLRGNKMRVHENFFNSVPKLQTLELGNNNLTHLEPGFFRSLTRLEHLNLWKNRLKNLTREVFQHLKLLKELDVSSNDMEFLSADAFQDLSQLIRLSLSGNNFSQMPKNLFASTPNLEVLRLYDNRQIMSIPDRFLSNLTKLKEVYLMRNNLQNISENTFWDSKAVTNLSLQSNSLKELPQEIFKDQYDLLTLDLSYNQLRHLPDHIFKSLGKLKYLRMGNNRLQNITRNLFYGLIKLEVLDLEYNELSYLDSDALGHLQQLKHARFSHNMLSFLDEDGRPQGGFSYKDTFGNKSPFRHCVHLEYLYLANNSITEIFSDWRIVLVKLRVLDLSLNKIQYLIVQDVQFISDDVSVDLRHNNITVVNLYGVEALAIGQSTGLVNPRHSKRNVRVLLEGNPLKCDCQAYEIIRYFENKLESEVYVFVTLIPGNLTCDSPEELKGIQATQANSRQLTCELDADYNCPKSCECKLRRSDWGLIVNCTNRGLLEIPRELPLVKYTNHTELFLTGNRIQHLPNTTFVGYQNVTHMYLSRNQIQNIDTGFLSPKIQELAVDYNNLTVFGSNLVRLLSQSTSLKSLRLNNNPWSCECSAKGFLELIQLKFKQIPLLSNVTCSNNNRQLSHLSISDLCPASTVLIVSCILIAAFGILVGSLAFLYYRYQREVKVWLYSHQFCLWFVTEQELDKNKLYDAFVSYSHKDEEFVINTLVPELESGDTPFKLCLHYRDWIAGEWIPNQIARSVENSRRTLVVLSPNFLESVWGRMEFRAAHKQALSEGRARVIVVLYGDVGPTDQLDPELKAYISMNTYVKWGDPWFWGKLKYALPHAPSIVKNNLNLMKGRGSRKEKNYVDDKLELIHTLDSPSSPTGGTTPPSEVAITPTETITVSNRNRLRQ